MKPIPWWLHLAHFGIAASTVLPQVSPLLSAIPVVGPFMPVIITLAAGEVKHAIAASLPPGDQ